MQSGRGAPGANSNPPWNGAGANPSTATGAPVTAWSNNPWAASGNASTAWAQYYAYYAQQQQAQQQIAPNAAIPKVPAVATTQAPAQSYNSGWTQPSSSKPGVTAAPQWAPKVNNSASSQSRAPASSSWAGVASGGGYPKQPYAAASMSPYAQYTNVESTYDPESGSSTAAVEPATKKQKLSDTPSSYGPSYSSVGNRFSTPNSSSAAQHHQRPPPPSQKPQQSAGPQEWPESLKRYVERAFAQYTGERERALMETKLRNIIRSAIENDSLKKRDWDKLPLPQLDLLPAAGAPKSFAGSHHGMAQQSGAPAAAAAAAAPGGKGKKGGSNNAAMKNDPFMGEGLGDRKAMERQKRFAKESDSYGPKYQDITTVRMQRSEKH